MTNLQCRSDGVCCGGCGTRDHAIRIASKHHERPIHIDVLQAVPGLLLCQALLLPGLTQDPHILVQAFLHLPTASVER